MTIKLWAIIDIEKYEPRFCYADENKTNGAMALYDRKPKIKKEWKHAKRVVMVTVTLEEEIV